MALFDEEGSQLVVLNEVGGEIWRLLETPGRGKDLVDKLVCEIDQAPPREQVEKELMGFLEDLYQRGAIEAAG